MADGIYVKILGDDSDLQNKLKSSGAAVAKWGAGAAVAAAAATAAMVKAGLASADAQAKLAAQLNTTSQDMAVMQRSADMAGVSQEKLAGASRALTNRLSQAAIGTGAAAASLDKLGLSAEYVQSLPLSERFAAVNKALSENVAANERAAIAATLYGDEAALAVSKISPDTIRTASDQVRLLNAALSEVDAAQVESANDAISAIGLATEGLSKQLAAEFAPALEGIATGITDAIGEMGGFGKITESVFKYTVEGAGYLANAWRGVQIVVDGLKVAYHGLQAASLAVYVAIGEGLQTFVNGGKRAINDLEVAYHGLSAAALSVAASIGEGMQTVVDGGKQAINGLNMAYHGLKVAALGVAVSIGEAIQSSVDGGKRAINSLIDVANKLTGINLEKMVIGESEALATVKQWATDANQAFSDAAEQIDLEKKVIGDSEALTKVKQWAADANQAFADATENSINMEKLVIGESEALTTVKQWAADANQAFIEATDNLHNRLMEPLPKQSLDDLVGVWQERSEAAATAAAEAKALEREQSQVWHDEDMETARARYAEQLAELEAYEAAKSGAIKLWKADEIKTEADMAAAKKAIDQASLKARLQVASSMMGNLSSLMDTENRKLFNIGKVAALAQATIDGYSAIQSSYAQGSKIGGPAVGAAFAATAAIATGVQIARIASTSFGSGGTGAPAAAASSNPNVNADQMVGGSGGGGAQQERVFRLEGLDPGALYTGDQLMKLADSLVELQNDGYRLVPS